MSYRLNGILIRLQISTTTAVVSINVVGAIKYNASTTSPSTTNMHTANTTDVTTVNSTVTTGVTPTESQGAKKTVMQIMNIAHTTRRGGGRRGGGGGGGRCTVCWC